MAQNYTRRRLIGSFIGWHDMALLIDTCAAHIVRNKTATSAAIASLEAISRWAVTGTPVQNSLSDIAGIFRFLHFRPYDNAQTFDDDVVEYFRRNDIQEGTRRLKALCQPIMLRRSKEMLALPPRQDCVRAVNFSQDEKREYQRVETGSQSFPEVPSDQSSGRTQTRSSAIQLINKLRVFCNLGLSSKLTTPATNRKRTAVTPETDSTASMVASDIALGGTTCAGCQQVIDTPDTPTSSDNTLQAYYSQCLQAYCNSCAALNSYREAMSCSCNGKSPCRLQAVPADLVQKAMGGSCTPNQLGQGIVSSKVYALTEEVLASLPEKRYVWTCDA